MNDRIDPASASILLMSMFVVPLVLAQLQPGQIEALILEEVLKGIVFSLALKNLRMAGKIRWGLIGGLSFGLSEAWWYGFGQLTAGLNFDWIRIITTAPMHSITAALWSSAGLVGGIGALVMHGLFNGMVR